MKLMIESLMSKVKIYNPDINQELLTRAYQFADVAHLNQKRLDGEPMIHHCAMTAGILTDFKVDDYTLAAALMHDVLEHTNLTKKDLEDEFGRTIASLVDGVSIIKKYKTKTGQEKQVENLRKLLLASAKDVRVVLIRLAEKLHSLTTLKGLPESLQPETIQKAFEIYAPLAERLGVYRLKWQIEDWAFKYQNHAMHSLIHRSLSETREEREEYIKRVKQVLEPILIEEGLRPTVMGRAKHLYSIYKKMLAYERTKESEIDYLKRLRDVHAFRVLVSSKTDCYKTLGLIHQLWPPVSENQAFKDYIAKPKPNGYRSLHTAVICEQGKVAEFQIRTHTMHEYNEFGPASHLYYKEIGREKGSLHKVPLDRVQWLKNLVEWQNEIQGSAEFEKALKIDAFGDRVFVFTPKGDVKDLRVGATPIDFAYSVHTQLGNLAVGAKVDGNQVPLDYKLQNGQVCEIVTSKKIKPPSLDWLKFVKTRLARHQINKYFRSNVVK